MPRRLERIPLLAELLEARLLLATSPFPTDVLWNTVQTADFNGDGTQEVVAKRASGDWWTGPSTLASQVFEQLTSSFRGDLKVVTGDFNGDGVSDVAGLGSDGSWTVGISNRLNLQKSTWGSWANPATWGDVQVGDFNGDGRSDIFSMNSDGTWVVAVSTGTSFQTVTLSQWLPRAAWKTVQVADFNGDGMSDLFGFSNSGAVYVGLSSGASVSVSPWAQWAPATSWNTIRAVDVNSDGKADVVGFNNSGAWFAGISSSYLVDIGQPYYFLQTRQMAQWLDPSYWVDIKLGDFNRDGASDIAGLARDGQWWIGTSTGTTFSTVPWANWGDVTQIKATVIGNFDGGRAVDLLGFKTNGHWLLGSPAAAAAGAFSALAASSSSAQEFTTWPDPAATAAPATPWNSPAYWNNATVGDLNGDGRHEIFGFTGSNSWLATPNNLTLFHSTRTAWPTTLTYSQALVGDFNGDGVNDVAGIATNGAVYVGLRAAGNFYSTTLWTAWLPGVMKQIFAADVTGDGKTDLVGFARDGSWWIGESTGSSFVTYLAAQWLPASTWDFVTVADYDRDGRADILGFNNDGTWWLGYSAGASFNTVPLAVWNSAANWKQIGVADFNGDGRPDLYGVSNDGSWWIGLNTVLGLQVWSWLTWTGTRDFQDLRIGDFNGDGMQDFLGINSKGEWWIGLSTGYGFNLGRWITGLKTTQYTNLLVGDFNGDGAADFWAYGYNGTPSILQGMNRFGSFRTDVFATDEDAPYSPGSNWEPSVNQGLFDAVPPIIEMGLFNNNISTYQDYFSRYYGVLRGWVNQATQNGVADADLPAFLTDKLNGLFLTAKSSLSARYGGLTDNQYRLLMTMNLVHGFYVYGSRFYPGSDLIDLVHFPTGDCSEYSFLIKKLAELQGITAAVLSIHTDFTSIYGDVFSSHAVAYAEGMILDGQSNLGIKVDLNGIKQITPSNRLAALQAVNAVYGFYDYNLKPEIRQLYIETHNDPGVTKFFYYYFFEGMGQGRSVTFLYY